ncbi:hypothetical protein GQ42DRAFT_152055 [Ramicandelaber brevisporus]|nr:hypothetical protein GQ42DRAFT_152055 [Ramicandelaber brevisporus]
MTSVQQLVTRLLEQKLSQYGFDLVHVFPVQLYNTRLAAAVSSTDFDRFKLPEWSQHSPSTTLGVLVGNTKSLWPAFIDNLAQDPSRLEQHPGRAIDSYTEEAITQCVGDALNESHDGHSVPQHRIWYSFRMSPGELLPFQRLVHSVGFAHLNRSANLCIHPKYGPWISFRSVIVIDCPGPALDDPSCQELDDPYPECTPLIREWFAAKLATAKWQDWVHLRDIAMPPHTKEYRYTEQQILYHYTKQEHILRDAIKQDTIAQKAT